MPVEMPRRAAKNKNVAICVQATFGQVDHRRLVEWFETQRLLGVSLVGVYITPATHPDTRRTMGQYGATSLAELRTIDYLDGRTDNGPFLMVNLAAINDCIYRHLYTHRFIAVIDFDEVSLILDNSTTSVCMKAVDIVLPFYAQSSGNLSEYIKLISPETRIPALHFCR